MKIKKFIIILALAASMFYISTCTNIQMLVSFSSYREANLKRSSAGTVISVAKRAKKGNTSLVYNVMADCYREINRRPEEFGDYLRSKNISNKKDIDDIKNVVRKSYLCYVMEASDESEKKQYDDRYSYNFEVIFGVKGVSPNMGFY